MPYMIAIALCLICHGVFAFNPDRVPSIRIDGEREPICQRCVDLVNQKRMAAGLEPWPVLPGAYDEQETD